MQFPNQFTRWYRSERQKLSKMSPRQKTGYILYYYKFHFLALVLVFAIFLLGMEAWQNSQKTVLLDGLITNDDFNRFPAQKIAGEYGDFIGIQKKEMILLDDGLYIDEDGQAAEIASASRGKIIAEITTHSLDFTITEKSVLEEFHGTLPMISLEQILPEDTFEKLKPDMLSETQDDGSLCYYALSMRNSRFLRDAGGVTKEYYLFAPQSAPHIAELARFIEWSFSPVSS